MLRILSLITTLLILFLCAVLLAGYTSVPEYTDSLALEADYSPANVWQELIHIEDTARRKTDVTSVQILEKYGKLIAWKEDLSNGGYRIYRMITMDENKKLVIEMTDSSYGLKGIWAFNIWEKNGRTVITISEDSSLTDMKLRGWRVLFGRNKDLLVWQRYIRVGLVQSLLTTP